MRRAILGLAAVLALSAGEARAAAGVFEQFGNILYRDANGATRPITFDHHSGSPVLSPDGRTVAWIHIDREGGDPDPDEAGQSSAWVADVVTGGKRKIAGALRNGDLRALIINPSKVEFSLDGGYLYIESALAATSPGIHQVKLGLATERFVAGGALMGVLRTGPYRGYLVIGQHRYHPQGGSYDGAYVVRPDGKVMFEVPGSEALDGDPVHRWLDVQHWVMT